MELSDYLRLLRAHWVGVVAITVAVVVASGVFTLLQPKVYAANASGFVGLGSSSDSVSSSVSDSLAKSRATSYVDLAESRATAQKAIDALGLDTSPSALVRRVTVQQPPDTVLIRISAEADSPENAQDLADAWVDALGEQVAEIEDPSGKEADGTPRIINVESAELPSAPVSPRPARNIALGALLGLMLGVAYAVVRSQLDRRIRDKTSVERDFGVGVAGSIPVSSVLAHDPAEKFLPVVWNASTEQGVVGAAEAFRKLRTNLSFMDVDRPPRSIVLSSPRPEDGKSTVAINLAAALESSGEHVVLVDADLRRPSIATTLGLDSAVGLTDVLAGRIELEDALQSIPGRSLVALTSGPLPPNPSELLGSQAMRALVKALQAGAIVIIDAPPLLPVTDAAVLSTAADGALVVVSAGKTLDTELGSTLESFDNVKGRILGIIFNKVKARDSQEFGGYYQGYYEAHTKKAKPVRVARGTHAAGRG